MSAPDTRGPSANGNRADRSSFAGQSEATKPSAPRDLAEIYAAKRYRPPLPVGQASRRSPNSAALVGALDMLTENKGGDR